MAFPSGHVLSWLGSRAAGRRLQQLIAHDAFLKSGHPRLQERPGDLGGFPQILTVERVLGSMNVIVALDGAPGTDIRMSPADVKNADPAKLIIRLENRLAGLDSLRTRTLAEIGRDPRRAGIVPTPGAGAPAAAPAGSRPGLLVQLPPSMLKRPSSP